MGKTNRPLRWHLSADWMMFLSALSYKLITFFPEPFFQPDNNRILAGAGSQVDHMSFVVISNQFQCCLNGSRFLLHQGQIVRYYKSEDWLAGIQFLFQFPKTVLNHA